MSTRACVYGVAIVAITLVACSKTNTLYCEGHPTDPTCVMVDATVTPDTPSGCTSNTGCTTAADPVCETSTGACVQCTAADPTACSGTTPVCGTNDACQACTAHTDCASGACLPDGSCGTDTNVAYIDPMGSDAGTCTKAAPCATFTAALAKSRPYIKVHGTISEQVTIDNQNVTILADPAAELTEASAGVVLNVEGSSVVSIYDLTIADGLGATGVGISMPTGNTASLTLERAQVTGNGGVGISATGGTLTISRSTISANTGGGLSLTSTSFDLENNFIVGNGGPSPSDTIGGVNVGLASAQSTLEFNTITANGGGNGVNAGVNCGTVTVPLLFSDNIIYGNSVSGGGKQFGGNANCSTTYSDIGPDTTAGTGNINADPMFVNATDGNYHITASSPCKDAADPAATEGVDFDGDTRPQGTRDDIGADEYKP